MGKKKFNQVWASQSKLGEPFGLSAITVGKILVEAGLKDQTTKQPTESAIADGYARATPLKDGTPYFMWNIEKVNPLLSREHLPLDEVSLWVRKVAPDLKRASEMVAVGKDKLGYMLADATFDSIPAHIRDEVMEKTTHISPFAE